MTYDSIKQWFLSVLAKEEQNRPAPIIAEEAPAPDNAPATLPNTCPRCGANLFHEVSPNIKRCSQCGHQERFERKRTIVPPIIVKPSTAPIACASCGNSILQEVGGGGWRCQACGGQTGISHSNGIKRSELETFAGGQMKMSPPDFLMALARFGRR
jgi:ribosomal protein L37AE/L43A